MAGERRPKAQPGDLAGPGEAEIDARLARCYAILLRLAEEMDQERAEAGQVAGGAEEEERACEKTLSRPVTCS